MNKILSFLILSGVHTVHAYAAPTTVDQTILTAAPTSSVTTANNQLLIDLRQAKAILAGKNAVVPTFIANSSKPNTTIDLSTQILTPTEEQKKDYVDAVKNLAKEIGVTLSKDGFWYANHALNLFAAKIDLKSPKQAELFIKIGDVMKNIQYSGSYFDKNTPDIFEQINATQNPNTIATLVKQFSFYESDPKVYLARQNEIFQAIKDFYSDEIQDLGTETLTSIENFLTTGKIDSGTLDTLTGRLKTYEWAVNVFNIAKNLRMLQLGYANQINSDWITTMHNASKIFTDDLDSIYQKNSSVFLGREILAKVINNAKIFKKGKYTPAFKRSSDDVKKYITQSLSETKQFLKDYAN